MKKIKVPGCAIPTHFVNINHYLNKYLGEVPDPPLHPATLKPITGDDLAAIFPKALIKQEVSLEALVEIPDRVREIYGRYRVTPLTRAYGLEKVLDTPAHIYFKNEGATLTGSHKLNTAIAQAYYNNAEGVKLLATETGAGQWGSALALASGLFGLKCLVFMVHVSFAQKTYRKYVMQTYGARVVSSPSGLTAFGRSVAARDPDHPGSLGIAISEALEAVSRTPDTKYALGSVLNHVLLHQTVVGQEARSQMEACGEYPDTIIGCVGGGSNFTGFAVPFLMDKLSGVRKQLQSIAIESSACPKMTGGEYRYDFGDTGKKTPLLKMDTLGCGFVPPPVHAGGLRYHGNAPILSFLRSRGMVEARAYGQKRVFESAVMFARAEGLIPAPESAHAIAATIDEAVRAKKEGRKKVILFNLSGHGLLDMEGYGEFLEGRMGA